MLQEAASWNLVYSMNQHGISLNTLYSKTQTAGPVVLMIRDTNNGEFLVMVGIFGAFADQGLVLQKGFYGSGSTFLYSFKKGLKDCLVGIEVEY